MSAPKKPEGSPTKKVFRTPAQDRLKRLQGGPKKVYKSPNRQFNDGHDNKQSKSSSSKTNHWRNVSGPNCDGPSTSAFAASLGNDAKDDAAASSSTHRQIKQTTLAPVGTVVQAKTPLQFKPQNNLSKRQHRLLSKAKSRGDESHVCPPKRKREEINLSPHVKLQKQNPLSVAKPFQAQKRNTSAAAARAVSATTGTAGATETDRKTDEVIDGTCDSDKFGKGDDNAYLRENLITTKHSCLHKEMNDDASTIWKDLNENRNSKNQNLFNIAKTKLKNIWEKPKSAFIDSFKKLQSCSYIVSGSSSTSTRNIANDRLNRYRSNLMQEQQQKQPDFKNNETIVPSTNTLPPSNSFYVSNNSGCEAMDWQSSEGNDAFNESHNDNGNVSTTSSTNNGSNTSVHSLDSIDFKIKEAMTVNTKRSPIPFRKQNRMYFVLDTNILLNYIVFVEELTKLSLYEETDGNVLFIPYKVIQELDNLKHRGSDSNRIKSSRAIHYLNDKFGSDHFQAQTAIAERKHLISVDSPDDSIINCCLQLKKEVEQMILLTDDANMLLKARVNGLFATTKSDLTTKFQQKFLSLNEN